MKTRHPQYPAVASLAALLPGLVIDFTDPIPPTPPPPAPNPTPPPSPAPTPAPPTPDPRDAELAALRAKLADVERKDMSDAEKARSDAQKAQDEAQKSSARASALEAKLARVTAERAFSAKNVVDPELAYLAIRDRIEIKDGEPTNIDTLVDELLKAKPHLVVAAGGAAPGGKPTPPDTRPTNPGAPPADRGDLKSALAKKFGASTT